MKKIMLLSNDFDLNVNLGAVLYRFNFRINCFQSEQGVMDDFDNGNRYDLYVLDMKAKDINLKLVKFLRENKNLTPILLVLDEAIPTLFKRYITLKSMISSSGHFRQMSSSFTYLSFVKCF